MPYTLHVLIYDYPPDIAERRVPYREAHLANIDAWHRDGRLLTAGALGDPPTGGLLVFRVDDPAEIEGFVAADPYRGAGLITGYRIQPWTVVTPQG